MIRRTALTSAAAIAAVVVTGTIAIGANLGLLATQDASAAPAAAVEEVAAPETIDLFLPVADEPDSVSGAADEIPTTEQEFTIDRAGTLVVSFNADGLQVDSVSPADGWEWETTESADAEVRITFTDGQVAIEFVASLNEDGSLSATVDELITEYVQDPSVIVEVEVAAPAPPVPTSTSAAAAALLAAAASPTQVATTAAPAPIAPAPASVITDEPASTSSEHEEHNEYEEDEHEEHEHEEDEHEEDEHEEDEHEEDEHEEDEHEEDEDREDEEDD
jgi:hypothetical protein